MSIKFTTVKTVKAALQVKTKAQKKALDDEAAVAIVAGGEVDKLADLKIVKLPIGELKLAKTRVRKTAAEQLKRVMRSIQHLNQCAPVVIDANNTVINGHIVVEALKTLGHQHVWCVLVDHLSEAECELLRIGLNRTAEQGEWDIDALGSVLIELEALDFNLDFSVSGFSLPELDILMYGPESDDGDGESTEDEAGSDPQHQPVSMLGDIWQLGRHLLLCGDATDPAAYDALMGGEKATAIFTDSPWNIKIEGFVSGLGKVKHSDFVAGAGEMTPDEFAHFCNTFTKLGAQHLTDGGVFFSCIDHRSVDVILAAGDKAGLKRLNMAVWVKGSGGGMGSYLRSAFELIPIFCKGDKVAINNVELGKHGRNRTNVWNYAGANTPGSSANKALQFHPTPKDLRLVEDALLDVTKRGGVVLDMFMGSGTTLLAAERCGRKARGIELDPKYVDIIIGRWQTATGKVAVHLETGLTIEQLAAERANMSKLQAA